MGLLDRLFMGPNRSRWFDSLKPGQNSERYQIVIKTFLIQDNIDVDKFYRNQEANELVKNFHSLQRFEQVNQLAETQKIIECSPSFRHDNVQDKLNRARGIPDWFYIGYPDVIVWLQSNMDRLKTDFETREAEFFNDDGATDLFLRAIINMYMTEGGKLECGV